MYVKEVTVWVYPRHLQINMYDSTTLGFLLCMLMILYNFNNATAAH